MTEPCLGMQAYILDADGHPQPATVQEWAQWFGDSQRKVAQTILGEVMISTVFLGLDHAWDGGPPILWETMIFGGPQHELQWRYRSKADALEGHAAAVALVQRGPDHA